MVGDGKSCCPAAASWRAASAVAGSEERPSCLTTLGTYLGGYCRTRSQRRRLQYIQCTLIFGRVWRAACIAVATREFVAIVRRMMDIYKHAMLPTLTTIAALLYPLLAFFKVAQPCVASAPLITGHKRSNKGHVPYTG